MAGKLSGSAIQSGTITTTQLASDVSDVISQGGGPKITSISYANGALAADNDGNSSVIVTGTGFNTGVSVYINGVIAPSVTRANSNSLSFIVPANTQGSTVPFYVVNTDGGSAVYLPGFTISGPPTWLTSADLGSVSPNTDVSLAPLFAYEEGDLTPIYATGGTVQNVNNYTIHTFTSTDTFSVSSGGGEIEYLIVAAGGGGGNDMGGGGGGGGVLANTVNVTTTNYTITIGAAGAGSPGPYSGTPVAGSNGGNSSIGTELIAVGGGGAGSGHRTDAPWVGGPARDGGSGGGASAMYRYGSAGQANGGNVVYHSTFTWQKGTRGGKSPDTQVSNQYYAGGGGGAGGNTALGGMANGSIDAVNGTRAGHGGDGYSSNISGTSYYYAGGGGGGNHSAGSAGKGGYGGGGGGGTWPGGTAGIGGLGGVANGTNGGPQAAGGNAGTNTGSGGGGGSHQYNGGSGGSGIVYIKYPKNDTIVSNLTYTVISGSLPPGLNLASNGVITGNVTNPANGSTTYSFTVQAGPDAENQYAERTFSLVVTNPSLKATGGTETVSGNYKIHTFTESGTFEVTANPNSLNVEYLVVGGGGGGGETIGGGGGGGNVLTGNITSAAVQSYNVTVGAGGTGGFNGLSNSSYPGGTSGNNSSVIASGVSITANGGGAGGGFNGSGVGTSGGHGGGQGAGGGAGVAAGPGTNAGGTSGSNNNSGAGGGGAGGVGSNSTSGTTGAGGAGISSSISGTLAYYAGGGGGGARDPSGGNGALGGSSIGGAGGTGAANGENGVVNTGSGGGGGGYRNSPVFEAAGGNGGSGIVILRYEIS
jgi:hypothetical protein